MAVYFFVFSVYYKKIVKFVEDRGKVKTARFTVL